MRYAGEPVQLADSQLTVPSSAEEPCASPRTGRVLTAVRQHYAFLVENLELDLSKLTAVKMLKAGEAQCITAELSSHARNVQLLKLCIRKSASHVDRLLDLISTDHQYIYDYVTFRQGLQ